MPSLYTASIVIGGEFQVNDLSILHFAYKVMWDKGSRLELLIHDPDAELQAAMDTMQGDPTPMVQFKLEWEPSRDRTYHNLGTDHTLFILQAGMVTTPLGLAIRIKAVDAGSILLRQKTLSHFANGVKTSAFIKALCQQVGLSAVIPETGDVAFSHRALQTKPIDHIRYELDRVLSSGGKPISLQFDDGDKQSLMGFEEYYDQQTQALDTISGGYYTYGAPQKENQGVSSSFNTTAYHFEMDQDFRPAIWGHQVSVNRLTNNGKQVTGEMKAKLVSKLGIQGDVLKAGGTRLQIPASHLDNPTSDEYFARAIMVNTVFQSEMSTTQGYTLIDPDFRAFDGVSLLNRKHLLISVTGGSNAETKHAIVPEKSVVMGYEHRLNRTSAFTKVFLRRGT